MRALCARCSPLTYPLGCHHILRLQKPTTKGKLVHLMWDIGDDDADAPMVPLLPL